MPPIVSIVGKSKSGKTTLIEKLVWELKSRGYQVATIKHAHHCMTFDEKGKDSWRHIQAGSEATAVCSPDKFVLVKPVAKGITLDEIASLFGEDYDIILTEGFKKGNAPKIEVHRRQVGPPFGDIRELVAIVTDEPLETKARQFSLEDVKGLADLLEEDFIKPQKERISIYVNNIPVPLTPFPKDIITNTLVGMVSSLKGVKEVRSLKILVKREPRQG